SGISHPFNQVITVYNDSGGACGPTQSWYSYTGTATDGSGISLNAQIVIVTFPNGTTTNPPVQSFAGSGTSTDSNGNQITTNGNGTFTDTLGITALSISGSSYSYTDSN